MANASDRSRTLHVMLIGALLIWTLASPPFLKAKQPPQQNESWLAAARKQSDIEAPGNPPFSLHADLVANPQTPKARMKGGYDLVWFGKGDWRREISFPGFEEIVVARGGTLWHASNLQYSPYVVYEAGRALSFISRLNVTTKETVAYAGEIISTAGRLQCFQKNSNKSTPLKQEIFCFDPATGNLVREERPGWNDSYDYADYGALGKVAFPHTIRVFTGTRPVLKIQVGGMEKIDPKKASAYLAPPSGPYVYSTGDCEGGGTTWPKPTKAPYPTYPTDARRAGIGGRVILYADIGVDGVPRGLSVLETPYLTLAESSIDTVKEWRFRPAVCTARPTEMPTEIQVIFRMRENAP